MLDISSTPMLDRRVLLFSSNKVAQKIAFQLRGHWDGLNCVVFDEKVDIIAIHSILYQLKIPDKYGEFWCFADEQIQKFGYVFSSKWLARLIHIFHGGDWNSDRCVWFWSKNPKKFPKIIKYYLKQ